jgi:hypothetical protein
MIVIGEVLRVVCSLCYLVWWTITFRPSVRIPPGGGLFLAGAVLGGLGGLVLLARRHRGPSPEGVIAGAGGDDRRRSVGRCAVALRHL